MVLEGPDVERNKVVRSRYVDLRAEIMPGDMGGDHRLGINAEFRVGQTARSGAALTMGHPGQMCSDITPQRVPRLRRRRLQPAPGRDLLGCRAAWRRVGPARR